MKKPEFSEIEIDTDSVRWGVGNHAAGLPLLARIQLRELTGEELKKQKEKYEKAKSIYERYVNKGQRFKPEGRMANDIVECKITFINADKQTVSWKQDNLTQLQIAAGFKAAAGKWSINSMLALQRCGAITFID